MILFLYPILPLYTGESAKGGRGHLERNFVVYMVRNRYLNAKGMPGRKQGKFVKIKARRSLTMKWNVYGSILPIR